MVGIGSRLFAVGYTNSSGAGGYDAVILEINPATGDTLSTTLYGGAQDDKANGVATNGTDLYVVGESKSFASAAGNSVGQNDLMLLRYSLEIPVTIDIKPGSDQNSINLSSSGVIPVAILSTADFNAPEMVDPDTISLAGAEVKMAGKSGKYLCHWKDVNGDELTDLICKVYTEQFNVESGATMAELTANTYEAYGGIPISGEDSIRIVPDK